MKQTVLFLAIMMMGTQLQAQKGDNHDDKLINWYSKSWLLIF
jgi:hypothetical protein